MSSTNRSTQHRYDSTVSQLNSSTIQGPRAGPSTNGNDTFDSTQPYKQIIYSKGETLNNAAMTKAAAEIK